MSEIVSVIALTASVFMGISIGASSVASAFGPVNSARSANVLRSALLAGFFAFLGAILQGGSVANRVGSGLLQGQMTTLQAASILLVGSVLVLASVYFDYPMPTAFTVVGAVVGAGIGFGTPSRPAPWRRWWVTGCLYRLSLQLWATVSQECCAPLYPSGRTRI